MSVPSPHNLSAMSNTTGIVGLTQVVNDQLMNGFFGLLTISTIFVICMIGFMAATAHAGKSFIASSWITFVLCLFLRILGLVNDLTMYGTLAVVVFSIAFVRTRD